MEALYKSAGMVDGVRRAVSGMLDRARTFGREWHDSAVVPFEWNIGSPDFTNRVADIASQTVPNASRGLFRAQAQPKGQHAGLDRLSITRPTANGLLPWVGAGHAMAPHSRGGWYGAHRLSDADTRSTHVQALANHRPHRYQAYQARASRIRGYNDFADAQDLARNQARLDELGDDAHRFLGQAQSFAGTAPASAVPPGRGTSAPGRFDHIDLSGVDVPAPGAEYLRTGVGSQSDPARLNQLLTQPGPPQPLRAVDRPASSVAPSHATAPSAAPFAGSPPSAGSPLSTQSAASPASAPPTAAIPPGESSGAIDDTRGAIEREIERIRAINQRSDELEAQVRAGMQSGPDPSSAVPPSASAARSPSVPANAPEPRPTRGTTSVSAAPSPQSAVPPAAQTPASSPPQGQGQGVDPRVWRYGVPAAAALGVGGGLAYNQYRDRSWYER